MFYCVLQFVQKKKLLYRMWCRRSCEANKYHQKRELAAFFQYNFTQGAIFSKKLHMYVCKNCKWYLVTAIVLIYCEKKLFRKSQERF